MLSKKVSQITPSYTIGISTKVKALKQEGKTIVDLSIGEPDFFIPEKATERGIEAFHTNQTKYDLVPGLITLREAIVEKLKSENGVLYSPSEIVVSSGAKHAITNSLLAILDPGDEVILPVPYWTSYPEMIKICGGVPILLQTNKADQFKMTLESLKAHHTPKTKMLFINNPSNPTGAVYTKAELLPIVNYCVDNGIYILSDEIYERICYVDSFTSIPSISEAAKANTILINGLSKSAAMTGLRIGYTASSPEIAKAIATIQGHLVSHPSLASQWAGVGALAESKTEIDQMVAVYKSRREALVEQLDTMKGIEYITPDGAFYLYLNIGSIKEHMTFEGAFSLKVCDDLLNDYNLAVVPGIAFGTDDYIRLSYATELSLVQEGLKRIETYLQSKLNASND
ncbi:MAG: aspartate aminotransferase [Clostridiales bacterium]|nr:aspartate aminotransferase [Clostridiales bacterium]